MKTYCVKCRTDTNNINPTIFKTKNNRSLMQAQCTDYKKKQHTKGIIKKKLNCKFIRINTSRKNYNPDYEASRIHTNKIKELEDKFKKLKLQLANLSVQNNDDNDNDNDNNKK